MSLTGQCNVRLATLEEIRKLREIATATIFPKSEVLDRKDNRPYARHFLIEDAKTHQHLAGCSFVLDQHEGRPAWQLYGVTIHSYFLIMFVGMAYEWQLIDIAMNILVREHSVRIFSSVIQAKILGDYRHQGWEAFGDQSDGPGERGPYQKVVKCIG